MRMWMVNPKIMCQPHLNGEHAECHMFIGSLKKKISMTNYFKNNLLEPLSLVKRHNALVNEFIRREYGGHQTYITWEDLTIDHLSNEQINWKIDRKASLRQLCSVCPECFRKAKELKKRFDLLDSFYTLYSCPHCNEKIDYLTDDGVLFEHYSNNIHNIECPHCKKSIKINIIPTARLSKQIQK